MLGPRHGMRWHQMHAGRRQRCQITHHTALGGTNIGQHRAWRQMRCDMAHGIRIGTHRNAENHAIAAFNGARGIRFHHIGNAKFAHALQRFRPARGDHNGLRNIAALFRHTRDGRPDQPNANQAEPMEQRLSHVVP